MRSIGSTEIPNWNPVPLVRGMEDWESNKQDNFGQILFPPAAPVGCITIPGIYVIPFALWEVGLGTGKIRIYVTDILGVNIQEITSSCSMQYLADKAYLMVPAIYPSGNIPRSSSFVYLRFIGLDNATGWTNRMLCSEPYQIRGVENNTPDTVEKQGTVILRWWSETDQVVEMNNDELLLPYEEFDFNFELGFDSQLSKPEYKKTQEGTNRDGLFFAEKTVITKEFHFFFRCPEYVLDALRFVHLADYVEVQQGIARYRVDSIDFDIKWEQDGCVAKVDCSFTTGTVLRKSGTVEY